MTMWKIKWDSKAEKQFLNLDHPLRKRILNVIHSKLLRNPDIHLIPLVGDKAGMYKFRVGDYRLLCNKNDNELVILVVKVKHRKEVYRN